MDSASTTSGSRSAGATALAAVLAGAALAALQPVPYVAVRALFGVGTVTDETNSAVARLFWTAPEWWLAVVAFATVLAIMLLRARTRGLGGGRVGAVIAASGGAYVLVGAAALAFAAGDPYGAIWYVVMSLGAILLAIVVAAVACWWARGYR